MLTVFLYKISPRLTRGKLAALRRPFLFLSSRDFLPHKMAPPDAALLSLHQGVFLWVAGIMRKNSLLPQVRKTSRICTFIISIPLDIAIARPDFPLSHIWRKFARFPALSGLLARECRSPFSSSKNPLADIVNRRTAEKRCACSCSHFRFSYRIFW